MIQQSKIFFSLACLLTILSCGRQSHETTAIDELVNKFPQLKVAASQKHSGNYHLVRSVSFGKPSIIIKLYSQPDTVDDKQEIILITNSELQSYAIPFFSNTYRDYWNFQFDNINQTANPINTTFEKQLNICLDTLRLNDTLGTSGKVANEILYSLLHCTDVSLSDSTEFKIIPWSMNNRLPKEDNDSCYIRLQRIWESISQEMFPNTNIRYRHSYLDKDNKRIYQFEFKDFKRRQRNHFKLNVFRQDCNWHLMATM